MAKLVFFVLAIAAILVLGRMVWLSTTAKRPPSLGLHQGRLGPCPRAPNCVSSQAKGRSHSIEPLAVEGTASEALEKAQRAIESMPRARIITIDDGYLHAEFTSRLFRFVDDLELLFDPELPGFQVRSASRVGKSDLGANRKRVEALRRRLLETG